MNYFNKALDMFSTNVVNPMYYVGFSSATIVASLILFQGFNTTDATNTISLLAGFTVTFLGVHLLNISRKQDSPLDRHGHSALEGGLMNPRLSLQGRMSLDGWSGVADTGSTRMTHGRRSSLYRTQTTTLFNAFEEGQGEADGVRLERLGEEAFPGEDDSDADERTHLRSASELHPRDPRRTGSRSHSASPVNPSQADPRRTSRPS